MLTKFGYPPSMFLIVIFVINDNFNQLVVLVHYFMSGEA